MQSLAARGELGGGLRIPDAVAPLEVVADLRARQVTASVTVAAPREGRPTSRVNWMLRQLRDAPQDLVVRVAFAGARETASLVLNEAQDFPHRLLSASDSKREPRSFTLSLSRPMGLKSGKARGSFAGETRAQILDFYGELMQNVKGWQPRAPKLVRDSDRAGSMRTQRDAAVDSPTRTDGELAYDSESAYIDRFSRKDLPADPLDTAGDSVHDAFA